MPTFNLKRFARGDGLAFIEPTHLLRLLAPFQAYFAKRGLPLSAPGVAAPPDLKRLMDVLMTPDADTPQDLTDALYYIHAMSTPQGMDLLLEEVDLEGCKASWLGEYHPADVAVKAWLDDPEMLQRKHGELHMKDYRAFHYYRHWARPLPAFRAPSAGRLKALEAKFDDAFARKNRGTGTRIFMYPQLDGTTWFLVRHGDPYRRESALSGGEPSSVAYRPLRFDVVAYDPVVGELRVHARSKWEITLYRLEFGLCLFGEMEFFSNAAKYTLDPLRADGPASLKCREVKGMEYAQLKEVHLQWGGEHKETQIHKALDVFKALSQRKSEMPSKPRLVRASFSVRFTDSREPRTVTVAPPNTAQYARDEDAALVDQWLQLRGFVQGPRARDDGQADQPILESA